jgi:hypothetical protein
MCVMNNEPRTRRHVKTWRKGWKAFRPVDGFLLGVYRSPNGSAIITDHACHAWPVNSPIRSSFPPHQYGDAGFNLFKTQRAATLYAKRSMYHCVVRPVWHRGWTVEGVWEPTHGSKYRVLRAEWCLLKSEPSTTNIKATP